MSNVELLARTVIEASAMDTFPSNPGDLDADYLAEFAGRECYQSFHRPDPETQTNAEYLAKIIRQRHMSVLAHASFTFRFTGVSRSLTHELIRHRFLAFSELSQRFVNMEDAQFVVPPAFLAYGRKIADEAGEHLTDDELREKVTETFEESFFDGLRECYTETVDDLQSEMDLTRKQAREAARSILPNCVETRIVVSGNVRAWRDFIAQRNTPGADAEIREVAGKVLDIIAQYAPNSVADLVETDMNQDA